MKFKISRGFIITVLIIFFVSGYFFIHRPSRNLKVKAKEIIVYKEPDCQCCEFWAYYIKRKGYNIKIVNVKNIEEIKKKYNIPDNLYACHTAVYEDYIFEGHLPVEAIEKVIREKPEIRGIALPGMPEGVPGMGGFRKDKLSVYKFDKDGKVEEFYRF